MPKVLTSVVTPGGVVPTVFALIDKPPVTPMDPTKRYAQLQNQVNRQTAAFQTKIAKQVKQAGTNSTAKNFQSRLAKEQSTFNKNIVLLNGKLAALDPNNQAQIAAQFGQTVPAYQSSGAPLPITTVASDPNATIASSGGAASYGSIGADGSGGLAPVAVPATKSSGFLSSVPTWAKWTVGIGGAIALIGVIKYRSATAPFRSGLNRFHSLMNGDGPRKAGEFVRSVRGG